MAAQFDVRNVPPGARLDLYVKPGCPYCRQAMQHYDGLGVPYRTHDAQNDREARRRMLNFTQGDPTVPAIVVDGTYVQSGWGSPPLG